MPRARNKQELITFGQQEFDKLINYIDIYQKEKIIDKPIFDNRKLKDLLAHLHAWHQLFFIWYDEGMKGQNPQIPAPRATPSKTLQPLCLD